RSDRDWSSDVCSSDLALTGQTVFLTVFVLLAGYFAVGLLYHLVLSVVGVHEGWQRLREDGFGAAPPFTPTDFMIPVSIIVAAREIGRASCREREGVAV